MTEHFGIKKLGKRDAEHRRPSEDNHMTHAKFLKGKPAVFLKACELAGVLPTRRQVSKWRRGVGAARAYMPEAIRQLSEEAKGERP